MSSAQASTKRWNMSELRKLPPHERDAILEEAAKRAELLYVHDPELTGFEAYGPEETEFLK